MTSLAQAPSLGTTVIRSFRQTRLRHERSALDRSWCKCEASADWQRAVEAERRAEEFARQAKAEARKNALLLEEYERLRREMEGWKAIALKQSIGGEK